MKNFTPTKLLKAFASKGFNRNLKRKIIMETEIWIPIKGWENMYHVSNMGEVKSIEKQRRDPIRGLKLYKERILKQTLTACGYLSISLCYNNIKKSYLVHRLVAESLINNENNLPCVNHVDGNKQNNRVENLEWCTYKQNTSHAVATGLFDMLPNAKLSGSDVLTIKNLLKENIKGRDIALMFSVSEHTISKIKNERIWKAV